MASIRLRKCAIALLLVLTTQSYGQQVPESANAPRIPANRASDSYAIYSLLLSGGVAGNASLRHEQQLAIAGETVSFEDMNPATEPDTDLQPPAESANTFQEALQDFGTRRQERIQLERRFKLDRPYTLISPNQVAEFRTASSGAAPSTAGYGGIVRFSEVYFNSGKTAALVYVDHVCATPCSNGQWIYLEKRDGQWVRRSGSTIDRSDSYAIYSLLMPGVPFQSMPTTQAQRFAIAGTTVSIEQMNPAIPPEGQLQAPPNNAQAFREAVQDFQTRRYERIPLEHKINVDRPYTLLTPDDVAELKRTLAGIDPGSQLQDKWAGYPGITFFSEVYFNTAHTAALVYMNNFCANLCANGQWIYLEKNGDQWVRRSGLNI
ncbi:MAG: hypothetical protein ACJ71S_14155 [Acidobacteriaceae bacterium]